MEDIAVSNGCGCESGIFKYFKPPYHKYFYVACCMHDDAYDLGGGKKDRLIADRNFFHRMLQLVYLDTIASPWKQAWLVLVALHYYVAVRLMGWHYFNKK